MRMTRTGIGELGRLLSQDTGIAAKHAIKRVDRFIGNQHIEPIEAMRGVIGFLARPRARLLVSMDWVEIRTFPCIMLAARIKGRAIPLLWSAYHYQNLFRSQNNIEYGLLRALRTMVPPSTQVLLLADRGFGRTEMARVCQQLGFDYIIRIKPDVYVRCNRFVGKLLDLPVKRGHRRLFMDVAYRKHQPVCLNVAVVWRPDQKVPWFLITSLRKVRALELTKIFAHRMSIEEYFRDSKSLRNGFALRLTLIKSPQRLNRMLLVLAIGYLLLVITGLCASRNYHSGQWCSNNRPGECSLVMVGRITLGRLKFPHIRRMAVQFRTELLRQNWG